MEASTTEGVRQEIEATFEGVSAVAVSNAAGEFVRAGIVPFAVGDGLTLFIGLPRSDPRLMQLGFNPSITLLAVTETEGGRREVEVHGKALPIRSEAEGRQARERIRRSGVDNDRLAYLRVVPQRIELRESGKAPLEFEFPENRSAVSTRYLLGRKALAWLIAVRAPFLTATLAPVALGGAIAWATQDSLNWGLLLLAFAAGALLHMAVNVYNDYFDHLSGNDPINIEFIRPFSGGSRAIQLGLLSPTEMLWGAILMTAMSGAIGALLAWTSGAWVLAFGVAGLISGVFYVGGPFKWAARGVGELVVGLNFGTLMTLGSYYVQTGRIDWEPAIASIPVGVLIAAVLYINEFPDFAADAAVGKRTWVVRLGREKASFVYAFMMVVPYLAVGSAVAAGALPATTLLVFLTAPFALRAVYCALRFHSQPTELAPANALTIITHIATGLLLTLGYVWDGSDIAEAGYVAGFAVLFAALVAFVSRGIEQEKQAFLAAREAT